MSKTKLLFDRAKTGVRKKFSLRFRNGVRLYLRTYLSLSNEVSVNKDLAGRKRNEKK